MPDTVINSKIYKKTGTSTYVLYHPETGAEQVIYSKTWDSKNYTTVSGILDDITLKLDGVGGVLEFCGSAASLVDAKSQAGTNAKGEVYVITNPFTWSGETYPENTLIVFTVDEPSPTPTDSQFVPLGGSNSAYATKHEALNTVTLSGSTFTFKYADDTTTVPNQFDITIPSIGTTAVNTLGIVSTIPSTGADSSIPNVAAVRAFAGSADNVIVTTTSSNDTYYITFVSNTDSSGQPLYVDSDNHLTYNPSTNVLNVTATQAINATTAASVSQSLYVFGVPYNGSAGKIISKGDGLVITSSGNQTTLSVGAGEGIAVSTGSVGLATTGIAAGTYSALQVDTYGRAKAGAQSIVFAENSTDPDLNSLVVGGLAFIGVDATHSDSTDTTHSIPEGTDPKIG